MSIGLEFASVPTGGALEELRDLADEAVGSKLRKHSVQFLRRFSCWRPFFQFNVGCYPRRPSEGIPLNCFLVKKKAVCGGGQVGPCFLYGVQGNMVRTFALDTYLELGPSHESCGALGRGGVLGIELISDTIGKLNTISVETSDDNLIPLYVLTQAYWTVVLGTVVRLLLPCCRIRASGRFSCFLVPVSSC